MKVIDLIVKLQELPSDLDVMFDITKEGADLFHFISVDNVEEVNAEGQGDIVLLESYAPDNSNVGKN